MSISFKRYVDITSGVIGANIVAVRELIGRLFTNNALLPPQSFVEFTSANDVGKWFGFASAEYLRAAFYFAFISKRLVKPQKISYARYCDVATAPLIWGSTAPKLLATFNAISAGAFSLTLGGVTNTIGPLNLSASASLAAVATALQTAINAKTGTLWTAATVAYDPTTNRFNLTGGTTGVASIAVVDGAQTLAAALGWLGGSGAAILAGTAAILAPGSAADTVAGCLATSINASNNLGSFLFMTTFTQQNVVDAATYNATLDEVAMYCQGVSAANASAWSAAVIGIEGVQLTLSPLSAEYPEMLPMMLLAATDYSQANATSNYMFVQSNLTASVSDDASADLYDGLRINYYGQTQTAGNYLAFYQRALMMGGTTTPTDQNTYANEIALKATAAASFMNLQIALPEVGANQLGRGALLNQLQAVVQAFKRNGVISVGKPFNSTQIGAITNLAQNPNAWYQVQNQGYWLDLYIESFVNVTTSLTEWRAVYTLIYSKDDAIRKIVGTHALV